MLPPVSDAEKLVWSVLEAERPSIRFSLKWLYDSYSPNWNFIMLSVLHNMKMELQDKTLTKANKVVLGKHEDSLMHRVAVAEILYVLDPTKKLEDVKLIEDSSNKVVSNNGALGTVMRWKLKDCIAVHKLRLDASSTILPTGIILLSVLHNMKMELQDKTLTKANKVVLGKHEDSLMHRVAVAEILYVLDPTKKLEDVKLIEDSSNKVVSNNGALGTVMRWKLKDCIAVHKLLDNVLLIKMLL
ncbi:uncharacterized protein LOC120163416 [Hibiscus syriacus]|uniref:uncharacterized protein LOC120163416 n=1 Tax=Hibiscus syriacus TaxID=106335 RepID=UPI001920DCB0|nr:uncharacterized protein LOC120163416 [Hibiscus syriacus]